MHLIISRALAIVALCAGLTACDNIILPPDDGGSGGGGGNGGGGGDTVITKGIINGIVLQDSAAPLAGLESARVALLWHRTDGTMRIGSMTKLGADLRFAFQDIAPLSPEDLLTNPASSVEANGIATIMLVTAPAWQVGTIIDMRLIDMVGPMYTSVTHDVIFRSRGGASDPTTPWFEPFGAGFTLAARGEVQLGERDGHIVYGYIPDPDGIAIVPVFGR